MEFRAESLWDSPYRFLGPAEVVLEGVPGVETGGDVGDVVFAVAVIAAAASVGGVTGGVPDGGEGCVGADGVGV